MSCSWVVEGCGSDGQKMWRLVRYLWLYVGGLPMLRNATMPSVLPLRYVYDLAFVIHFCRLKKSMFIRQRSTSLPAILSKFSP